MWGGFFGLCAQWGLMMRLTWYEYSWDVMEPIAYFISFGTRASATWMWSDAVSHVATFICSFVYKTARYGHPGLHVLRGDPQGVHL